MSEISQVPGSRRPRRLWHNIIFMITTPALAAILVPLHIFFFGWSWGLFSLLVITYTISILSITAGYHRYFAHRSYELNSFAEFIVILTGAGAFQSSILQWSTDHRRHHRVVDTDEDPYSINKGFWYAHLFWMFNEDMHPESRNYPKDLTKNRWIMWQHNHYVWVAAFMGFVLPGLIAWACGLGFWGGVIFGGLLRIVLSQHSTFLINSAAHTMGRKTYTDRHTAGDSFLLAFLTMGEGYHNFHHSFQADYRNGMRWWQWDPTKWLIAAMSWFGLASRLKRAQREEILKARIVLEETQMISYGAPAEKIQQLKQQILEAQKKLKTLRDSYRATRREAKRLSSAKRSEWKQQMRSEIRKAKLEFRTAYGQWRLYRKKLKRAESIAAA